MPISENRILRQENVCRTQSQNNKTSWSNIADSKRPGRSSHVIHCPTTAQMPTQMQSQTPRLSPSNSCLPAELICVIMSCLHKVVDTPQTNPQKGSSAFILPTLRSRLFFTISGSQTPANRSSHSSSSSESNPISSLSSTAFHSALL